MKIEWTDSNLEDQNSCGRLRNNKITQAPRQIAGSLVLPCAPAPSPRSAMADAYVG